MAPEPQEQWVVSGSGGLVIRSPGGDVVVFPVLKAAALVALVALSPGQSVPRGPLAASLWPDAPGSTVRVRLRQALRRARASMGEDAPLCADRARVWLEPGVVRVEPPEPGRPYLPEFTEPCFATFRPAHERPESQRAASMARQSSASRGVFNLLGWTARYRPSAGLEVARLVPELLEAGNPADLRSVAEDLLRTSERTDPLIGWAHALRGLAVAFDQPLEVAAREFLRAERYASESRSPELYVFARFYRLGCLLTAGRVREALQALREDRQWAGAVLSPDLTVRRDHGRGLTLVHGGSTAAGLRALWEASERAAPRTSPFDLGYLRANLAWFEATVGSPDRAARALEGLRETQADDCVRLEVTALLAEAGIALQLGEPERVLRISRHAEEVSRECDLVAMTVYTGELIALAHMALGQADVAADWAATAADRRQRHGFGRTLWDDARLAPLGVLGA